MNEPSTGAGGAPRRRRSRLGPFAWLAIAAVAWRAIVLVALWAGDPLTRAPMSDALHYEQWANAVAAGVPWRPGLPHWLPPLYPWVLSVLVRAGAELPGAAVVLHGVLGVLTTLLVARLAASVAGRAAGIAAGVLWLAYAPVLLHESRMLGVNLALPLAALALVALVEAVAARSDGRRSAPWLAALAGFAGGLAVLVHPNLLIATPLAAVGTALALRGARVAARVLVAPAVALALGFAIGVAPGLVSNLARSGEPVLVTANGGVNFWFGNRAGAGGTFEAPGPEWGSIDAQRDVSLAVASRELGREVGEREASRWWFRRALAEIAQQPGEAFARVGRKLAAALSSEELDVQVVLPASRAAVPALWLAPLPFGALLALAVLGARERVRARAVLLAWIAAGLAATLLYFHYPRFRLVWMLALAPFAGAGAMVIVDVARGRRRLPIARAGAALVALAASLFASEGTLAVRQHAHAHVDQGLAWSRLGNEAKAAAAFRAALDVHPGEVRARVELARYERSLGRREAARALLEEALALPVDYPGAVLALAGLELTSPAADERARGLERALAWLAAAPVHHPQRRDFELLVVGGMIDRAKRTSGSERDALVAEARRRLDALGAYSAAVRDPRALLDDELRKLESRR